MRSSYFLNLYLTAKCSGLVGQLSIFQRSFFCNSFRVIKLYLHFSWLNSVRQTEQRRGFYLHVGFRQMILIYSSLCFSFMQFSLDLILSLDPCFIIDNFILKFKKLILSKTVYCIFSHHYLKSSIQLKRSHQLKQASNSRLH